MGLHFYRIVAIVRGNQVESESERAAAREALAEGLATSHIDLAFLAGEERESQERRLTPEFVEGFFVDALSYLGGKIEPGKGDSIGDRRTCDGSASLDRGTMWELVREQLSTPVGGETDGPGEGDSREDGAGTATAITTGTTEPTPGDTPTGAGIGTNEPVIKPAQRYRNVSLQVPQLPITKTNNLQPYLFKVLQEKDPNAKVTVTVNLTTESGIDDETITNRIVEGLDMLNIQVDWDLEG